MFQTVSNPKPCLLLIFFNFCLLSSAYAAPLEVSCIGDEHAPHKVIYLHGADTPTPGAGEEWQRYYLSIMAQRLGLRIALPRSHSVCPKAAWKYFNGTIPVCWNEDDATVEKVLEARKTCFDEQNRFGMIGFSSGGHLMGHWLVSEKYSHFAASPDWFVLVSSGKHTEIRKDLEKEILSHPRFATFVWGNQDRSINTHYIHSLGSKGINVQSLEFIGGHVFPPEVVEEAVRFRLGPPSTSSLQTQFQ